MKRKILSAVSVITALALLMSFAPCYDFAFAQASYSDGDTFACGSYPQSLVTDESVISALNSASGSFSSFGFYSGSGSRYDGTMAASDYMRYRDAEYNGEKYRAVIFDTYRPYLTGFESNQNANYTYQDDNGYASGTVYWFKYEPVMWQVLDAEQGLCLSSLVLDSQAFNDVINYLPASYNPQPQYSYYCKPYATVFASDYENSSLRAWLNGAFYDLAFTDGEKQLLTDASLENKGFLTLSGATGYTSLDSADTSDRVFALSSDDAVNEAYGFGTADSRLAFATDYARCMGVYTYKYTGPATGTSTYDKYDSVAPWRLRTAGNGSNFACCVTNGGGIKEDMYLTSATYTGIRPAVKFSSLTFYSVGFNANGGTDAPASLLKAKDAPVTIPADTPSNPPYDFLGWASSQGAQTPEYLPGDEYTANADTVLYAVWGDQSGPQVSLGSVSQDADGNAILNIGLSDASGIAGYYLGTNETVTENVFTSASGSVSPVISQSGTYYFAAVDTGGRVSDVLTVTLYLTEFNGNGGTPARDSVLSDGYVVMPSASMEGCNFIGWADSPSAEQAQYRAGEGYTFSADTTVYAVWQCINCTLIYNANGGSGAPAAYTGYGEVTISDVIPVRSGYTFIGWSRISYSASPEYAPGGTITLDSDFTLYAVWEQNPGVSIRGFASDRSVDYKTTIVFTALTAGDVSGCTVQWYKNGSPVSSGEKFRVNEATAGFTVEVRLIRDGTEIASSGTETVNVSNGFFARIVAFFRGLFGKLPYIEQ